ncbi:MAG: GTPase HflX [Clostridia bacterium]|nr:GTPase HflX [Clostridia bacterium]
MSTTVNNEKAILVSIAERSSEVEECERSLDELERLLNTSGASSVGRVLQVKESFDPRTCIGSGKVKEIADICQKEDVKLVVFDFELSPMQIRNLENDIGDVTVIDRSMLILDIFALHATSGDGKLQVELAQLRYSAPRLTGKGVELSRQGGGIGSRGPGESKLETDRRHLKEKINALESRLSELEHNRLIMRAQRDRSGLAKIGIVGYTNAGKSTLLNRITGSDVLSEDKLFATLDPTTRKSTLPSGETVLFTDTVGFVRKLPHHLVKAFKSTLDEVKYSDLLLIVSDATDPEVAEHIKVTEDVISELGASDKPRIYVYNKADSIEDALISACADNVIYVSAKTGDGIDTLLDLIEKKLSETKKEYRLLIPYDKQSLVNSIYGDYSVKSTEYTADGTVIVAVLDEKGRAVYGKFITD